MKKYFLMVLVVLIFSSFALAQGGQGIHEPGTGIESPEVREAGQGTGQGLAEGTEPTLINADSEDVEEEIEIEEMPDNKKKLRVRNVEAHTNMEMVQEQNRVRVTLSNGRSAELKIMPDTASERALERLRLNVCSEENNCQIELKEVGEKVAYEVRVEKKSKVFGLFRARMQVQAQVDAENGEIIRSKKPWWAFLASETDEVEEDTETEEVEETEE